MSEPVDLVNLGMEPDELEGAVRAEKARRSLHDFMQLIVWPVVEPARKYIETWFLRLLCEHLECVSHGETRYLLVNAPPRSLKSIVISVAWPLFDWAAVNPGRRWIFDSHTERLTKKLSGDRRDVALTDFYQQRWPKAALTSTRPEQLELENVSKGVMFATSTLGTVTGVGGCIVLDDPMSPEQAQSDTKRKAVNRWISSHFASRFDEPKVDAMVLGMQRLHVEDPTGYMLKRADWTHLIFDAMPDQSRTYCFPRSGRIVTQNAGEPLCPERQGIEELKQASIALDQVPDMDGYHFMAQYRQQPTTMRGEKIKREWWRFWHYPDSPLPAYEFPGPDGARITCGVVPLPKEFDREIQSWDPSVDATEGAADTAGMTVKKLGKLRFVMNIRAEKMDFMRQCEEIRAERADEPNVEVILIEKKGNGAALIRALEDEMPEIEPVVPTASKDERLKGVKNQIVRGYVVLAHPDLEPLSLQVVRQCAGEGVKSDLKDSMSQALNWLHDDEFSIA